MAEANVGHRKAAVHGLGWMYLSSVIQGVSKLAVLAVLTRLLSPRDFGLVGIALVFTSLVERIGQVGVGPALVQRPSIDGDDVATGRALSTACGGFMTFALWLAAPSIAAFFEEPEAAPVIRALSIGFLIDGLAVTSDALLQRSLDFRKVMLVENASYIIGIGATGAALACLGFGVWALVAAQLAMRTLRAVLLARVTRQPGLQGRFRRERVRALVWLGGGFSLGRILNFVSLQGDTLVVGRLLGMDALGLYSRAYQLMALPAVYVAQVLERVLFPVMARRQLDIRAVRRAFLAVLELLALVSLPAGVFLLYAASPLIEVLFGPRWSAAAPVLAILSFGVFFRTAYKCSDTVVRSMGAVYRYALQQGVYAACVILGSLAGAVAYRTTGVAVGVVLAVGFNYLCMTRLSASLLQVSIGTLAKAHLPGALCALSLALSLGALSPMLERAGASPLAELAALALVAAVVCGVTALVALRSLPGGALVSFLPGMAEGTRWSGFFGGARATR